MTNMFVKRATRDAKLIQESLDNNNIDLQSLNEWLDENQWRYSSKFKAIMTIIDAIDCLNEGDMRGALSVLEIFFEKHHNIEDDIDNAESDLLYVLGYSIEEVISIIPVRW